MKKHYKEALIAMEGKIKKLLSRKVKTGTNSIGLVSDWENQLIDPKYTIYSIKDITTVYCNKDSKYYQDDLLHRNLSKLINYVAKVQRTDGTFDLLSVNYYSAPDTAFMAQRLAIAYRLLQRFGNKRNEDIKNKLKAILDKAARGMSTGGFHTPNHRWVIAAALTMIYNITENYDYLKIAQEYLAEGIDINEDGEYTERSTGIYNAVNDNALIILSEELNDLELLKLVERNLEMMLFFVEPDNSFYTGNSTRQDQNKKYYLSRYYYLYLYTGWKLKNKRFIKVVNSILENGFRNTDDSAESLHLFMFNSGLKGFQLDEEPLPTNYEKHYKKSGVVRVRRENMSFTISENSSRFLKFKTGELEIYMKICTSFFEIGQFNVDIFDKRWNRRSNTTPIKKTANGYQLEFTSHGTYYLPFGNSNEELEWGDMKYDKRVTGNEVSLKIIVSIKEIKNGIKLSIKTNGCDRVPIKFEFGLTPGCVVEGDSFIEEGKSGQSIVAKSGYIRVRKDNNLIKFGPGFAKHTYTSNMRGSEPRDDHSYTVYFTDFTNLEHTIEIRDINNS